MKNRVWAFAIPAVILLAVFLVPSLLTSQSAVMDKPSKEDVAHKMQTIQIPFVANNGQVDKQVKFYANTFGGTVFVTKDGEIVYSLPKAENSGDRCQESDVRIQGCRSELRSPNGCAIQDTDNHFRVSCIMHQTSHIYCTNCLFAGLAKHTGQDTQGVAIKETLVGGRVQEITGNEKAVTKVSYFKGNDTSQWKTNISTYGVVSLGEVYDGIELKLKAYGNNVEKLFCVKPGADPEQIKVSLSGIQPSESSMTEEIQPPESPFIKGDFNKSPLEKGARGLWVNDEGQLVAETELGPVKFTKPVAYQEIEGKRVYVDVAYCVQRQEAGGKRREVVAEGQGGKGEEENSKFETTNSKTCGERSRTIENPKLEYGFKVASYDRTKPLIIDPLLASTFLGGGDYDEGLSLILDTSGNVYVTGWTWSSDFPTTSGAYDTSCNDGYYYDGFWRSADAGS